RDIIHTGCPRRRFDLVAGHLVGRFALRSVIDDQGYPFLLRTRDGIDVDLRGDEDGWRQALEHEGSSLREALFTRFAQGGASMAVLECRIFVKGLDRAGAAGVGPLI